MTENFVVLEKETRPFSLKDMAAYQDHSVVSREIVRKPAGTMTVFAFDEGEGLSELARHLQAGTVLALHEYAASIWPNGHDGPWIRSIRRLGLPEGGPRVER